MLEVLRIDPESRQAHYRRQLVYEALAQKEAVGPRRAAFEYAAGEARKAFEKYRIDDDAQEATNSYRAAHPHDNRMAQRIVIHDLVP